MPPTQHTAHSPQRTCTQASAAGTTIKPCKRATHSCHLSDCRLHHLPTGSMLVSVDTPFSHFCYCTATAAGVTHQPGRVLTHLLGALCCCPASGACCVHARMRTAPYALRTGCPLQSQTRPQCAPASADGTDSAQPTSSATTGAQQGHIRAAVRHAACPHVCICCPS